MAVLKYKDSSGVWRRLFAGGISDEFVLNETKDLICSMVDDLESGVSSVEDIIIALQDGCEQTSTSTSSSGESSQEMVDRIVKGIVRECVGGLNYEKASIEDVILGLQNGSTPEQTSSSESAENRVKRIAKSLIYNSIGTLDAEKSPIEDVIFELQEIYSE